jgi:hypothetical protein
VRDGRVSAGVRREGGGDAIAEAGEHGWLIDRCWPAEVLLMTRRKGGREEERVIAR